MSRLNESMREALMGSPRIKDESASQGLWSQITQASTIPYDPYKTVSISADEKE